MFEQQDPPPEEGMNLKQKLVVIFANIFILAELTTSIYLSHHDQENMARNFLVSFIPMVLLTIVATRILLKRLR
jgi:heme/copper-type cytochrome/quinol oxidase subunit 4